MSKVCGSELEMGYGLAGGGMGPYMYCSNERCNFLQKFQDPEMAPVTIYPSAKAAMFERPDGDIGLNIPAEEPDDARAIRKDEGQVQDRGPERQAGETEGGENLQRDPQTRRSAGHSEGGDGAEPVPKK